MADIGERSPLSRRSTPSTFHAKRVDQQQRGRRYRLKRIHVEFPELRTKARGFQKTPWAPLQLSLYHRVGFADECPTLLYAADWREDTPDKALQSGPVLCVESYIGRTGGREGVKLAEQMLITETGWKQLSSYPLDNC